MIGLLVALALLAFAASRGGGTGEPKTVRGKSGRTWRTRVVTRNGGAELVQVDDVELGTMVLRYVEQNGRRFLAATAPTVLVTAAMSDLNVEGPGGVPPAPAPGAPPVPLPPNPSPAVPVGKVRVERGTYEANVTIDFPASLVVGTGNLASGIAGKGFTNVSVTDERPAGWGVAGDADYFVRATWPREPVLFDRPKAIGNFRRIA